MITVKVQCGCGQRYAFDVEPFNGRMPSPVACPVCGVDGTAVANEIIAQTLPPTPPPPPAPVSGVRLSAASRPASSLPPAPVAQAAPSAQRSSPIRRAVEEAAGSDGEKWKWWYFVLAGVCFGGYAIWQAWDQQRLKPLGQLFFAAICIAIGIWDFQHKRKKRLQGDAQEDEE